jgi:hypothetical protein
MPEDEFEEVLRVRLMKRATSSMRSDDEKKAIENRLRSYRNEKLLRIRLQEKDPSKFKKVGPKLCSLTVYQLILCRSTALDPRKKCTPLRKRGLSVCKERCSD